MTVLVTGGAGYVGSHVVKALRQRGEDCVVLDNLDRGHRELVGDSKLIVGDIADSALVRDAIDRYEIDAVMHFAAYAYVGESVADPMRYYRNNVASTSNLLDCLVKAGVRVFVFSSSCATYGVPECLPIPETHPQRPVSPYGWSKLMVERMLLDLDAAFAFRSISFRYFNAAGADPDASIGEWHEPETHLIPIVLQTALGDRKAVEVFGTDHATPDGTCIRDYVHVSDLAQAHVLGLDRLRGGQPTDVFNLGNGQGYSVRVVIETAQEVTGRRIAWSPAARRPGDPPALVGCADKARRVLGWSPQFGDLATMIETAWRWQRLGSAQTNETHLRA